MILLKLHTRLLSPLLNHPPHHQYFHLPSHVTKFVTHGAGTTTVHHPIAPNHISSTSSVSTQITKRSAVQKRKFPVPPRRSDTASKDWLDDSQADFSSSTSQTFDQPSDPPASDMTGYRPSSPAPRFPLKSSLISHLITLHTQLCQAPGPNAFTFCLQVPSQLNIPAWRSRLASYPDTPLCDFLEFGWPVGYSNDATAISLTQNHGSALSHPEVIDAYLTRECELGAICSPFLSNPFSHALTTSPLQIAYSRTGKTVCGSWSQFPARLFGQRWNSHWYMYLSWWGI